MKLLYTGGYAYYDGVEPMLEGFLESQLDGVIQLTGTPSSSVLSICSSTSRFDTVGFLSRSDLHTLCLNTDIFLAPRMYSNSNMLTTFPSKMLSYLAYNKCIMCVSSPAIPEEILDCTLKVSSGSHESWLEAFLSVRNLGLGAFPPSREKNTFRCTSANNLVSFLVEEK